MPSGKRGHLDSFLGSFVRCLWNVRLQRVSCAGILWFVVREASLAECSPQPPFVDV
eukprot:CAMPEP_0202837730 /NCGR_PEP_ID=MMETSP1389-20130828/46863_1 /ASSEMBLY_ACC=CAM_ASM_000865 /TAXON_ID=302021 /ORGANISM="Rhodomonas sp., Strain CCMP768" /LENGTH=55 /DNA_ID=CAMNT_0049513853 /DNA_START=294 /DNA_END=458 /DNA_ORIENTATION=+